MLYPCPIVRVRVPMMPYRRPDGTLVQPEIRSLPDGSILVTVPGVDAAINAAGLPDAINEYTALAEASRSANPAA